MYDILNNPSIHIVEKTPNVLRRVFLSAQINYYDYFIEK